MNFPKPKLIDSFTVSYGGKKYFFQYLEMVRGGYRIEKKVEFGIDFRPIARFSVESESLEFWQREKKMQLLKHREPVML